METIPGGENLTDTSETQGQTIVAYDKLAGRYDDLFSRTRICTQRESVWEILADTFRPGDAILALNCRTREDALFLFLLDVSVVAREAPEGMIDAGRNTPLQLDLLPVECLSKRCAGALFDGALSNFSGLNSVADLDRTAHDLATMVTLGAPVIVCLSTRFCLSETLWFLFHGKVRRAFRRSFAIATVKIGDCAVKIHYPTLGKVRKSFSPSFLMRSCTGIGVAIPPSFLEPVSRKYPRVLGLLRRIDKGISHLPLFRSIGDHMLLYFERVEG